MASSFVERIARGVKATFAANVVDMAANAALVLLLTRVLLTPDQFGTLNFALAAMSVVAILATLGIPKSAGRYVTQFVESDPGLVPHVVRRSLAFLLASSAVVAVGVVALGRPVATLVGQESLVPFLGIGAAYVVATALTQYVRELLRAFGRVEWSGIVRVVTGVGRVAGVVALVGLGFGIAGALAGYVVGYAVAALVGGGLLYVRLYRTYDPDPDPEAGLSRRIAEYSVPLTATRGANVLDKRVDVLLVGALLDMTAVGFYTVAKQVSDFVSMPASSFGFTVSPALSEQRERGETDRAARVYERSLTYVLLAYVPAVTGLALVAGPMVRYVFGADYLGAVPVVQVYAGFILVNAVNKVTSDGLDYLGRARSRAVIKSAMAVANAVLNLILIPRLGVVGAALATVITYTVYTGSNVYFIHQELSFEPGRVVRALATVCLVTVGMALSVWVALPYVSGIATLLATVLLGVVVWAVLSVAGGVLDPEEVADILG
ncbi:flippase (plasmid) [Halobaculum sp. CBA1158]|uniref:flippase n=1 Tax=Halobaculum sp. CBA1158 TaxID=2904243 RepID=UPI001F1D21CE|nr:flippase [Halobaculum sp. CBA1158]UIP01534.1 flippase [Halobaculum sp. CBA1158]